MLLCGLGTGATGSVAACMLDFDVEVAIFAVLIVAMLVKLPAVPLHRWLPIAHSEACTEGSVLLAAVVLKLSGYGLCRFMLPMFVAGWAYFGPVLEVLAMLSVLYGSLVTLRQVDFKKLVAYSSVAHMGLVLTGLFSGSSAGVLGVLLLLWTHALSSAGLFLAIGAVYERLGTRLYRYLAGAAEAMPLWCGLLFVLSLMNLSLPGTGGFVAEVLILVAACSEGLVLALVLSLTLVFSGAYSLWLFNRVAHGA